MHNFVYLAQRRREEFSCEPNYGGRAPPPPLVAPVKRHPEIHVLSVLWRCWSGDGKGIRRIRNHAAEILLMNRYTPPVLMDRVYGP